MEDSSRDKDIDIWSESRKCVTKEMTLPVALQDAIAALYSFLDQAYRAKNISISGYSVGGLKSLLYLNRYELEIPECVVRVIPFVDIVDDCMGDKELLNTDFLIPEMLGMVEYQY